MSKRPASTLTGEDRAKLLSELLRSIAFFLPEGFPHRVNVMQPAPDGAWRITHQVGMDDDPDRNIAIEPGEGATGQAVVNRVQVFQKLADIFATVSAPEAAKLDRQLRWILSTPIERRSRRSEIIGVVNVDGTRDLEDESRDRLSRGLGLLTDAVADLLEQEERGAAR